MASWKRTIPGSGRRHSAASRASLDRSCRPPPGGRLPYRNALPGVLPSRASPLRPSPGSWPGVNLRPVSASGWPRISWMSGLRHMCCHGQPSADTIPPRLSASSSRLIWAARGEIFIETYGGQVGLNSCLIHRRTPLRDLTAEGIVLEDMVARADELKRSLEEKGRQIEEVHQELADLRFTWESGDGLLAVALDGQGSVLELSIDPAALQQAHPQYLGGQIVTAINEARAYVTEETRERIEEVLGANVVDEIVSEAKEHDADR
ncbi:MAG: hypothetical protein GEV03_17530 [Streptosporangiales bacterium]|nr:hypothetical protein [Streptosporangiales bacterium]